jgi:hypothetical protein
VPTSSNNARCRHFSSNSMENCDAKLRNFLTCRRALSCRYPDIRHGRQHAVRQTGQTVFARLHRAVTSGRDFARCHLLLRRPRSARRIAPLARSLWSVVRVPDYRFRAVRRHERESAGGSRAFDCEKIDRSFIWRRHRGKSPPRCCLHFSLESV